MIGQLDQSTIRSALTRSHGAHTASHGITRYRMVLLRGITRCSNTASHGTTRHRSISHSITRQNTASHGKTRLCTEKTRHCWYVVTSVCCTMKHSRSGVLWRQAKVSLVTCVRWHRVIRVGLLWGWRVEQPPLHNCIIHTCRGATGSQCSINQREVNVVVCGRVLGCWLSFLRIVYCEFVFYIL